MLPTKEFNDYAKAHLVLVEVDFPQRKKQGEDLQKANKALMEQFKIEGFPTLLLLDGEGKRLGEVELEFEPKPLLDGIEKLRKGA